MDLVMQMLSELIGEVEAYVYDAQDTEFEKSFKSVLTKLEEINQVAEEQL